MEIVFAAIGGPEVATDDLAEAIQAISLRPDFEEVAFGFDVPFAIRFRLPWNGARSAWCDVEVQGADALSTLIETARAIAAHVQKPVRAMATGVERRTGNGVEIGYRAVELLPDGTSRSLTVTEADEASRAVGDDHPTDELGEMLAVLVDDAPSIAHRARALMQAGHPGRCFRRKALIDDPRLARLAATILAAKAVCSTPDPSGRIRLRIDALDGGKQISFVSTDEAATLQRATNRL